MSLSSFLYLLKSYTTLKILIGCTLLGISVGITGVFMILQKKDLLGDTISHATLAGITISYILFQKNSEWVIWIGAIGSSLLSLFLIEIIKKYSKIKLDTILSLIMASFFGLGTVLMAYVQKDNEDCFIAILEKFILGQTALISEGKLISIIIITFLTLFTIIILWKELKIFTFDSLFAQSLGFSHIIITFILNILLIGVIIISLKVTGIILTSAFLIMPGVIARQISDRLSLNIVISSVISFIVSFIGVIISILVENMPTGPIITIITTILIFGVFLLSPQKGILKKYFKQKKYRKQIRKFKQLIHFYNNMGENYKIENIESFLLENNYLCIKNNDKVIITTKGIQLVENLINGIF